LNQLSAGRGLAAAGAVMNRNGRAVKMRSGVDLMMAIPILDKAAGALGDIGRAVHLPIG
jgi:hypothetical protein